MVSSASFEATAGAGAGTADRVLALTTLGGDATGGASGEREDASVAAAAGAAAPVTGGAAATMRMDDTGAAADAGGAAAVREDGNDAGAGAEAVDVEARTEGAGAFASALPLDGEASPDDDVDDAAFTGESGASCEDVEGKRKAVDCGFGAVAMLEVAAVVPLVARLPAASGLLVFPRGSSSNDSPSDETLSSSSAISSASSESESRSNDLTLPRASLKLEPNELPRKPKLMAALPEGAPDG